MRTYETRELFVPCHYFTNFLERVQAESNEFHIMLAIWFN